MCTHLCITSSERKRRQRTIMNPLYLFDSYFTNLKALPVLMATLQSCFKD
uniref:Uncharacterized protein n=1 Tax=Hyaloperonospora arabidopsidis (strain Emoy2) TaxID=559515 RepID=M4BBL0_HYAAE